LVEELWQLLDSSPTSEANSETLEDSGDDLMVLSANAVHGTEAPQTMKLLATLFSKQVIILIDSGSFFFPLLVSS
jgi:hypothetical protein